LSIQVYREDLENGEDLKEIVKCTSLTYLNIKAGIVGLASTPLTDTDLPPLEKLTKLRTLIFNGNHRISPEYGLALKQQLSNLQNLSIQHEIDD